VLAFPAHQPAQCSMCEPAYCVSCRRKNLGYLYAIQGGARVIYETDDDNQLYGDIPLLPSPLQMNVYVPNPVGNGTEPAINVYATFGLDHLWPRGFPLDSVRKPVPRCFEQKIVKPWIQQGKPPESIYGTHVRLTYSNLVLNSAPENQRRRVDARRVTQYATKCGSGDACRCAHFS
jgi:hypothetical protein